MREELTDVSLHIRYTEPLTAVPQLRYAIEAAISLTASPPKTLPPAHKLASALGIAPNTAFRAYRLLAGAGLVESDRGAGTAIKPYPADHQDIIDAAHELVEQAQGEGRELAYVQALISHLWPEDEDSANDELPSSPSSPTSTAATGAAPVHAPQTYAPVVHYGDWDDPDAENVDFS